MLQKQKPYLAVMIMQLSFAGMFLLSKSAISGSGLKPPLFVAYRQAFGTVALAPFAFFCRRGSASPPLSCTAYCNIFIISTFGITFAMNLGYAGLKYTSATFATAILNIIPVLVFVMAVCFRMERLAIREWHGMAKVLGTTLGFSGAMAFTFYKGPSLFSSPNHESSNSWENTHISSKEWVKGSLLMLAGQSTWAMWITVQGPLLKKYPGRLRLTFLQNGFGFVTATIYGACVERNILSWKLGWNVNLLAVAYSGIVVNGLCYWLQAWVIEKKGPVFSANFGPLGLILATILSAIFLGDTPHLGSVIGGLLMVGGLYSFTWGTIREAQSEAQYISGPSKEEAHLECIVSPKSSIDEENEEGGERKRG